MDSLTGEGIWHFPASGATTHGEALQRERLLIMGGHAGIQAGANPFGQFSCLAKNPSAILPCARPVFRPFSRAIPDWPKMIVSG
jgi:hypothetical protein